MLCLPSLLGLIGPEEEVLFLVIAFIQLVLLTYGIKAILSPRLALANVSNFCFFPLAPLVFRHITYSARQVSGLVVFAPVLPLQVMRLPLSVYSHLYRFNFRIILKPSLRYNFLLP